MNLSSSSPLVLETVVARTSCLFRQYRVPFLSSVFFGLLAYGFAFTNKLINHDEAHSLFMKGGTVSSGRWGLGALDTIFPNYSMPWIYGIITVVLVAVTACVLVSIFSIQNRLFQGLLGSSVMVFPSLIGLFGYMFTSSSFGLAFLLAVVSVKLLQSRGVFHIISASVCLIFSLSIYQSYISVTASLLVLVLIRMLLTGSEPMDVLKLGIFYVIFLLASLAAYWVSTQAVLMFTGTEMGAYASGNFTFTPSAILSGAAIAYRNFFRFFSEGFCGLIPTVFSRRLHICLLVISAVLLMLLVPKKLSLLQSLLLAVLVILMPLAINCMYMITAEHSIHTLVLYSFTVFYVFVLVLADLSLDTELRGSFSLFSLVVLNVATLILAIVIVINTYVANQAYLNLHLRYENAYAFYSSLAADIKLQPEFDADTKLAVIGNYQQPEFYTEKFEHIHAITGVYGFVPDNYSNESFLTYYVGFPVPFASQEELGTIQKTEEYAAMPSYPYYGSMKFFGDILVVKLS